MATAPVRKRRTAFDEEIKLLRAGQEPPALLGGDDLDLDPIPEPAAPEAVNQVEFRTERTATPPASSGASTAEKLMQQQLDAVQPAMDEKTRKSKGQSAADFYRQNPFDNGFFKTASERADVEASRFPVALPRPRPTAGAPIGQAGTRVGNTITSPYGTASVTGERMGPPMPTAPRPAIARATGEQMGPQTPVAPKVAMRATAPQLRPVPVAPASPTPSASAPKPPAPVAAAPAAAKAPIRATPIAPKAPIRAVPMAPPVAATAPTPQLSLPKPPGRFRTALNDLGITSRNNLDYGKPLVSDERMNRAIGSAASTAGKAIGTAASAVGSAAVRASNLRLGDLQKPANAAAKVLNLPRPRPRAMNQTAAPERKKTPFNI